jgi:hypothetical protein
MAAGNRQCSHHGFLAKVLTDSGGRDYTALPRITKGLVQQEFRNAKREHQQKLVAESLLSELHVV